MGAAIAWANVAEARELASAIDVEPAPLAAAIAELARETGNSIGAEGSLPQLRTPAVRGRMTIAQALARLLAGTGWIAVRAGPSAWRIVRAPSVIVPPPTPAPSLPPPLVEAAEPIVVTGVKRSVALSELPMSLAVYRMDATRQADPHSDTTMVASQVEGVALTSIGPGRNRMFLRGVADSALAGESQSTVAVILDEARLTFSAPDPDIRLVDVDQVEVLKGPQGSLYGTGALGGIYHIVTRKPDADDTELVASAGAEAIAGGGTGWSGSGVANLPLLPGKAALRLVGYSALEPGWVDTGQRHDSNRARVLGARGTLGLAAGSWRFDLTGFAQWLTARDSQYVYRPGARARPAQLGEPHDNDLRHVAFRATRKSGSSDIVLSSAMTWHEVGDTIDATIGAQQFGLPDPRLLEDDRAYRVWDNEARVSGRTHNVSWLVGLSHVRAKQASAWKLTSAGPDSLMLDDDRRTTIETALFGNTTFDLASRLQLDVGARLFRSVLRETRIVGEDRLTRQRRRDGITPTGALSWRPRNGRMIYLRYASAYRQGGADISQTGQIQSLKSDKLSTIEAGWRDDISGAIRLDASAYYSWWRDVQSDLLQDNGLIETENAGQARIMGVEASVEARLGPGWRSEAGGTWTNALLTRSALGFHLEDRHLPVVPEFTLRGSLRHDFTIGRVDAWLRAQLRYIGPARLSFDPLLDRPMGRVLESRLEAHAGLGSFDIALAADNVFAGKADTFAYGNWLRIATMRQYTPQRPASVSLQIVRKF